MAKFECCLMISLSLLCGVYAQVQNGNIWDMLINDGNTNSISYGNSPASYQYYAPSASSTRAQSPVASSANVGIALGAGGSFSPTSIIKPKTEFLKLVESCIKLKAEVVARFYALAADNWDIIQYWFNKLVDNIGTLSAFTLNGIVVLRKILETIGYLLADWRITVPNINVDFSTLLRESKLYNNVY